MSLQLHTRRQHWEGLGKRSEHMLFSYWCYSNSKDSIFFNSSIFAGSLLHVATTFSLFLVFLFSFISRCKGLQFEAAWNKHRDDPNLTTLAPSLSRRNAAMVDFLILYCSENDNMFKEYDIWFTSKSQPHLL